MAARVMGQDSQCEEFHQELLALLGDPDVMVRRNAALALVRFDDASGRSELVGMLEPHPVAATSEGTVSLPLRAGQEVGAGILVARFTRAPDETVEVRAPFAGQVRAVLAREGQPVRVGDPLVTLAPEFPQVWEALRALCNWYGLGHHADVKRHVDHGRSWTVHGNAGYERRLDARGLDADVVKTW